MNPRNGGWLIALTVIAGMVLAVFQVPGAPAWLGWLRPDWGVVVFFYWTVRAPGRTGVVSAWFAGILFDVLLGRPLGLHGAGFAIATYVAIHFQSRLAMYTVAQQTAVLVAVAAGVALLKALALFVVLPVGFVWTAPLAGVGAAVAYPFLRFVAQPLAARWVRT